MENQNPNITISVPIYLKVTKKRTFSINLNEYRNAHFFTLNKAKIMFAEAIAPALALIPKMVSTKLHFQLFFGSNRDVDTANVCSIVEKFFCDAAVEQGILEDDNRRFLLGSSADFGGVDTKNPRVEVTFYDYTLKPKEQPPMRLILSQADLAAILIKHYLPILGSETNTEGRFVIGADDNGNPVGVLDFISPDLIPQTPVEAPKKAVEAPVDVPAPTPAPKVSKARQAASAASPKAVTPVTLVATEEGVSAVPVEDAEEDPGDKADIFDLTPRQTAVQIENDAQEQASHEDQAADAGTKEEKPALTLFPKGDTPKAVQSPAAAPVDRRGLFAAQNGNKPTPKEAPKAGGPVGSLFQGLSKPKHVTSVEGA